MCTMWGVSVILKLKYLWEVRGKMVRFFHYKFHYSFDVYSPK